jgi:pectate lyase
MVTAGAAALGALMTLLGACGNTRLFPIGLFDGGAGGDLPGLAEASVPDATADGLGDGPTPTVDAGGAEVALPPITCPTDPAPTGYAAVASATLTKGTVGGQAGATVVASTLQELTTYAQMAVPLVIEVPSAITAPAGTAQIKVTSDKTIVGTARNAGLAGVGLYVLEASNVIIRQLVIQKVPYPGDSITIQHSNHVWVDHCELFSDRLQPKEVMAYDDLIDVTHASDNVTISWNDLHDNYHPSLVGHSASASAMAEDPGHLTVTFHHNHVHDADNNTPRVRFGTVHVFNNLFQRIVNAAIESQMSALVLVEANVFDAVGGTPITTVYDDPVEGFVATNPDPRFANPCVSTCGADDLMMTKPWPDSQAQLGYTYTPDPTDDPSTLENLVSTCAGPRW